MGQNTFFAKDKNLYLQLQELYKKLELHDDYEIYLDTIEIMQIQEKIDNIYKKNKTEFYDLFRTNKRNEDGTYTNDVIFSRKECFEWIQKTENLVSLRNNSIEKLNDFWDKYPNGVIYFG